MGIIDICFGSSKKVDGYVEFRVQGVSKGHCKWVPIGKIDSYSLPRNVPKTFFGVALREKTGVLGKKNCKCATVCWVDYDGLVQPSSVLPPTAIVWSGHGWHLYWRLSDWCFKASRIEKVNEALQHALNADACHNIDRVMRLPGTINTKDEKNPVLCRLTEEHPGRVYTLKSLYISTRLGSKTV